MSIRPRERDPSSVALWFKGPRTEDVTTVLLVKPSDANNFCGFNFLALNMLDF